MTIEYKICNSDDAPNLAFGWATHVISILDADEISRPDFSDKAEHLIIESQNIQNCEFLDFTRHSNNKILIHCNDIDGIGTAVAMVIAVQHDTPPPMAMHNLIETYDKVKLNKDIITLAAKILEKPQLASFYRMWTKLKLTEPT